MTTGTVQTPPRVWLLASPHSGDNTQLLALAHALGWPFAVKQLAYKTYQPLARLMRGATLAGVDRGKSSDISLPYPDLILCAGRATEAIALWIRRHGSPAVRVVAIGTPWAPLDQFDLVITTPQYRLREDTNVVHNTLPLHAVEPEKLSAAATKWKSRFDHFPRPWIAVLTGGSSGPYTFDPASGARLGRQVSELASAAGGALLVTTSARTSQVTTDALAAALSAPSYLYRWASGSDANPYLAYLALADQFIVTADSISMLTEACATGRAVMLFDTETGPQSMRAEQDLPSVKGRLPALHWRGRDVGSTAFRFAMRCGPAHWSRDLRIVHRQLIDSRRASWLGDPPPQSPPVPQSQDMARAVARVRALFGL